MMYDDFNRGFSSITHATVIAVALWFGAASSVVAEDLVTPASPKGEFGNECATGLASGQEVKTDCSVSWSAPDGKVYCFLDRKIERGLPPESRREYPEGAGVFRRLGPVGVPTRNFR